MFFGPQHKGHTREPQESNNLFLNFFFTREAPQSSDITNDGQYQTVSPKGQMDTGKSDGWRLKTTAAKQLTVGWISGLFLFHWNESSERHSLLQGDQVKLDASPL